MHHGDKWDPRYGDVSFYHLRQSPTEMYMYKNIWTDSSLESYPVTQFISARQNIANDALCRVRNYDMGRDNQFFTSFNKHGLAFEYYDDNIDSDLRMRGNQNYSGGPRNYTEPKVWYIINQIVNADMDLRDQGKFYHGDIQPATVLITPPTSSGNSDYKLIDSRLVHPTKNLYERMLYDSRVKGALSPDLLEQLARRQVTPRYDPSREDSWALGMTALCMLKGKTLDDYYDWRNKTLYRDVIYSDLDSLNGEVSIPLADFVRRCLEERESQRIPMEGNRDFLTTLQRPIRNFELDFRATEQRRLEKYVEVQTKPQENVQQIVKIVKKFDQEVPLEANSFFQQPMMEMPTSNIVPIDQGDGFFSTTEVEEKVEEAKHYLPPQVIEQVEHVQYVPEARSSRPFF